MQEILEKYQVRKTNKQKTNFINYLKTRLNKSGYTDDDIKVEEKWKGLFNTRNIVIGNPETADIILTAHYDTQPVMLFPNFMFPTNIPLFILSQVFLCGAIFFFAWLISVPFSFLPISGEAYIYIFETILFMFLFWMMFGLQNKHCANDNTSGTIALVKILEKLPQSSKDKVCVVFFDNEEKGLFGSLHFKKKHKEAQNKLLINLDCIGDGNYILSIAPKKARNRSDYNKLSKTFLDNSEKYGIIYKNIKAKPMMFSSDQMNFDLGVGMCAVNKSKLGFLYAGRIHTPFDTKCSENNIEYISNSIINYIGGDNNV